MTSPPIDVTRLALLIPTLDRSGAEKQLTLLATGLPQDEFDVHVFALTRGGPYVESLENQDIPVTILHKRRKFDLAAARQLRRMLRELQPDLLHTWLFAASAYGRMVVDRSTETKVIVSERCVDTWKAGWQRWLDRRLISRTDHLVGNSQSVVDFYVGLGFPKDRTSVIYNGLALPPTDIPEGSSPESSMVASSGDRREEFLRSLDLPDQALLVGFVGRLARQKRVEDMLWATQLLRQAEPRAYLLIIGDGPERSRLEQFAHDVECADHVRFLGHRDDATSLLRHLDVFWLTSDFEGLSNSLMEAMACGVPVVASNIGPNRELIHHGDEGYLVDVGDGVGFAQFTVRLLHDPTLADSMGRAGRSRIEHHFSVERMVTSHVDLYRSLAGV